MRNFCYCKKLCVIFGCITNENKLAKVFPNGLAGSPQSWKVREKFLVMESHRKVMENKKNVRSHGKIIQNIVKRYGSFQNCPVMKLQKSEIRK